MSTVLNNYMGRVAASDIEADPRVAAARAALEAAEALHAEASASAARLDKLLPALEENERRVRAELEMLRQSLPGICAGVVLGEIPEASETEHLGAIAAAERVLSRCALARPSIEARIRAARATLEPRARAVESRHEELSSLRTKVREELAIKAL